LPVTKGGKGFEGAMTANLSPIDRLPDWVPDTVRVYLAHTETGTSLREIARSEGVHASTVMRQVRRFETRRDDPLVEGALGRLLKDPQETDDVASAEGAATGIDEARLTAEARRVLPRLAEPGALMAVAADMERAVVLRDGAGGTERLAVLDRPVAEVFALRDWIACRAPGRVSRYEITTAGRAALKALTGVEDTANVWRGDPDDDRRTRPVTVESPVAALSRRRDRDGNPFLTADLVAAAERLREDFEVSQLEPGITQSWERMLTGRVSRQPGTGLPGGRPSAARARVQAALADLGPGLADMALRCCCYMEGLETAERNLGWSARSGKIVLRIALWRLKRHYDEIGEAGKMIG
jgi:hypothetical protein